MRNDYYEGMFLCHSAKGKTWGNHKYVAKTKLSNGKWHYWYDLTEYQNYLKRQGKSSGAPYAKAEPDNLQNESPNTDVKSLMSKGITGNTIEEKTKNLQKNIADGEAKISEMLSKSTSSKKSKSKSKSSKKKSNSSKKSKGASSGKKSSSKSKGTEKTAKEKAAKEKVSNKNTTSKENSKAESTTAKKEKTTNTDNSWNSLDSLKKLYGLKDDAVNEHTDQSSMLESMKKYEDGSFGYIVVGNKTYKWTKEDGKIKFKDFDTEKEVSLPTDLKDIHEFRTDKKKK